MCSFRALISAVTLLAIAINPVVAAMVPCCCTTPAPKRPSCCETVEKTAPADQHACCAKTQSPSLALLKAGCCCFKLPTASPPAREGLAKPTFEKPALDFAGWSLGNAVDAANAGRLEETSSRFALSGPPIRALYCIWLK